MSLFLYLYGRAVNSFYMYGSYHFLLFNGVIEDIRKMLFYHLNSFRCVRKPYFSGKMVEVRNINKHIFPKGHTTHKILGISRVSLRHLCTWTCTLPG